MYADVDECLEGPCGQGCNNTDGGFVCYCRDGYTLQPDETTCMGTNNHDLCNSNFSISRHIAVHVQCNPYITTCIVNTFIKGIYIIIII